MSSYGGTFSKTIQNHYNLVDYTIGGTKTTKVHIFKTTTSEIITPAIYVTGSKQLLKDMVPSGISSSKIIAKTNGNVMADFGSAGASFYGFYYANGKLYKNGATCSSPASAGYVWNDYPSFCLKTDGTAAIRWFASADQLTAALPYCRAIIGSTWCMVYNGRSVFDTQVYAGSEGKYIVNPLNFADAACLHRDNFIPTGAAYATYRTFFGHLPNSTCVMVVCDSGINMQNGSKMMADLGCDYAVNLDGGPSRQMHVASAYRNGASAVDGDKMNAASSTTMYGTAIIAHL